MTKNSDVPVFCFFFKCQGGMEVDALQNKDLVSRSCRVQFIFPTDRCTVHCFLWKVVYDFWHGQGLIAKKVQMT